MRLPPAMSIVPTRSSEMRPLSRTTSFGRLPGCSSRIAGPLNSPGRRAVEAVAEPTIEPAGHALASSCDCEHVVCRPARFVPTLAGRVTLTCCDAPSSAFCVTVMSSDGNPPAAVSPEMTPDTFGANGSESQYDWPMLNGPVADENASCSQVVLSAPIPLSPHELGRLMNGLSSPVGRALVGVAPQVLRELADLDRRLGGPSSRCPGRRAR